MQMPRIVTSCNRASTAISSLGLVFGAVTILASISTANAVVDVYLTEVPDYQWNYGCFGTATGNLMGFWDRHGMQDFYTGSVGKGVAPLDSFSANAGIVAMWASSGHINDYYAAYQSTQPDSFVRAQRTEHTPDCIGDFIGLSQKKWKNMNGECDGNLDAYSFVYWDATAERRINYTPSSEAGPPVDIQSGLRAWTAYRGYGADVFTQLTDFNPNKTGPGGFTFDDMKAELDAGYPVLLFMQAYTEISRPNFSDGYFGDPIWTNANPEIHGMLAYGYFIDDSGTQYVRYRTSWATGDANLSVWTSDDWTPEGQLNLPVRGVIGFHPLPKITSVKTGAGSVTLQWDGPEAQVFDNVAQTTRIAHWYVVERADSLSPPNFQAVAQATSDHTLQITNCCDGSAFFRVRLVPTPAQ